MMMAGCRPTCDKRWNHAPRSRARPRPELASPCDDTDLQLNTLSDTISHTKVIARHRSGRTPPRPARVTSRRAEHQCACTSLDIPHYASHQFSCQVIFQPARSRNVRKSLRCNYSGCRNLVGIKRSVSGARRKQGGLFSPVFFCLIELVRLWLCCAFWLELWLVLDSLRRQKILKSGALVSAELKTLIHVEIEVFGV